MRKCVDYDTCILLWTTIFTLFSQGHSSHSALNWPPRNPRHVRSTTLALGYSPYDCVDYPWHKRLCQYNYSRGTKKKALHNKNKNTIHIHINIHGTGREVINELFQNNYLLNFTIRIAKVMPIQLQMRPVNSRSSLGLVQGS